MPAVIDPVSGLELYELSHRWGMYTPIFPGYEEIKLERITHHAKQGVMTHKITTIFHTSTHLNAPIHLVPGAPAVGDLELQKFFGTGVVAVASQKEMGPDRAVRSGARQAGDQGRRHRPHQHRLASQIRRQQGIFRLRAGPEQARRGVAGQKARKARRHRHRLHRSSAGDVAWPAPQRPADQISAPRIQGGHRPRGDQGFSGMECGASHAARSRHSDHRECRRRSRCAQRQALHVPGLSVEMA